MFGMRFVSCRPSRLVANMVATLLLLNASAAWPDEVLPDCAANPAVPKVAVSVPGFPNERLYLQPKHPKLCKERADCSATAYVVTGNELTATDSCAGWAFVSFKGTKQTTFGWVPTRRLPDGYYGGTPLAPIRLGSGSSGSGDAQSSEPKLSAIPACAAAQTLLNNALKAGKEYAYPELPAAAEGTHTVEQLPDGRTSEPGSGVWDIKVGDTRIQGRPIKVASYDSGGTCNQGSVELWTADLKRRLPIKGSNVDEQAASDEVGFDYASEALVRLAGRPYFAHISRSGDIRLYGFNKDLSTYPVCDLTFVSLTKGRIRTATEPEMCRAVLEDKVAGAPLVDIEPIPLTAGSQMVARGSVDIENDGKRKDVGVVEYSEESGAGCGHEFGALWPVLLNADGMPLSGASFNDQSEKLAGRNSDSRLFTFQGATYFEIRSRSLAEGPPEHTVWKFTSAGAEQACVFDAAAYYATDIAKPQ